MYFTTMNEYGVLKRINHLNTITKVAIRCIMSYLGFTRFVIFERQVLIIMRLKSHSLPGN